MHLDRSWTFWGEWRGGFGGLSHGRDYWLIGYAKAPRSSDGGCRPGVYCRGSLAQHCPRSRDTVTSQETGLLAAPAVRETRWTDLLPATWSGLQGSHPDPQKEADKDYDALVSLGYLVKHSFVLSAPITKGPDFISLDQRIRRAPFSDQHWFFSYSSNRINAVICVADLPLWEDLVRAWETQRFGPPNHSADISP